MGTIGIKENKIFHTDTSISILTYLEMIDMEIVPSKQYIDMQYKKIFSIKREY